MRYTYLAVPVLLLCLPGLLWTVPAESVFSQANPIGIPESRLLTAVSPEGNYNRRRRKGVGQRRRWKQSTAKALPGTKVIPRGLGRVRPGPWGGQHIVLTVTETQARFEIDCAHGTINEALTLDAHGRFSAAGIYLRERGGDVERGGPESHPALFTGWTNGKRMKLTIRLTDVGQTIGEFSLALGQEPQMTKCL